MTGNVTGEMVPMPSKDSPPLATIESTWSCLPQLVEVKGYVISGSAAQFTLCEN